MARLMDAIEKDLQNGYLNLKTKENWNAICANLLAQVIRSYDLDDSFMYTSEYVKSKSKEEIIEEIKRHDHLPENRLSIDALANGAASGIIYTILRRQKLLSSPVITSAIQETLRKHNITDPVKVEKNKEYIIDNLLVDNYNVITRTQRKNVEEAVKILDNSSIIDRLCAKIDNINTNQAFKDYVKEEIKNGTISPEDLKRYGITESELLEYSSYLETMGSFDPGSYGK